MSATEEQFRDEFGKLSIDLALCAVADLQAENERLRALIGAMAALEPGTEYVYYRTRQGYTAIPHDDVIGPLRECLRNANPEPQP